MPQGGFFDFQERCHQLHQLGNPLERLDKAIDWEQFRGILNKVHEKDRKNNSGRKPWDVVLMFRLLVLKALYNLSDEQMEYQIRDRISFMQFLGLGLNDAVPDARTIWLFQDQLSRLGLAKKLFARFDRFLSQQGYTAKAGSIIDASIVEVPKQRNNRQENKQIQEGRTPKSFRDNPAKARQKDVHARWVTKGGRRYFGYKNHVNVDAKHKLIRHYTVTDAAVHDSQVIEVLLDKSNSNQSVYGDSAYRSDHISKRLKKIGFRDCIHRKGYRDHPLSQRSYEANCRKSRIRARVEHSFGRLSQFGEKLMRCVGRVRARSWIGLRNLVYNMDRYAYLSSA